MFVEFVVISVCWFNFCVGLCWFVLVCVGAYVVLYSVCLATSWPARLLLAGCLVCSLIFSVVGCVVALFLCLYDC